MPALDVALHTGRVDGKLTSLTYNDLKFSEMYTQFLKQIHRAITCMMIYVSHHKQWSRLSRVYAGCILAALGSLCTNFTLFAPIIDDNTDMHSYHFSGYNHIRFCYDDLLYKFMSISNPSLVGTKMGSIKRDRLYSGTTLNPFRAVNKCDRLDHI